jgi:hypothetical protein
MLAFNALNHGTLELETYTLGVQQPAAGRVGRRDLALHDPFDDGIDEPRAVPWEGAICQSAALARLDPVVTIGRPAPGRMPGCPARRFAVAWRPPTRPS